MTTPKKKPTRVRKPKPLLKDGLPLIAVALAERRVWVGQHLTVSAEGAARLHEWLGQYMAWIRQEQEKKR